MNEPRRICVFYSRGPHFTRVLKTLSQDEPSTTLIAMVPPGYPRAALAGTGADIIETECGAYGLRNLPALLRLVRSLRAARYDQFVVMFDSPKLRLLAGLSGARECRCHTVDSRVLPVRMAPLRTLLDTLARNLRGRIAYAYIRWVVYHRPVKENATSEQAPLRKVDKQ